MIELAPRLEKDVDYDTAWLYHATCTHDDKYNWRLLTKNEYYFDDRFKVGGYNGNAGVWYEDRITPYQWYCLPVRTK